MVENKGTILVVDDDMRIRRMLKDYLTSCGYVIIEAQDGEEALNIFYSKNSNIHLILLDVMMPKKDGIEVLTEIRDFSNVPIIMLTAKGEEYDQLRAFKKGADDFMPKPFSPILLLAHIEAVLKRCVIETKSYSVGSIEIDEEKRQVTICDNVVEFTPKEYELLVFLIQNQDIALSRENILNAVWNFDYVGDLRTVDTHIKQLRAKLTPTCPYIRTIHGFGYRFEV